MNGYELSRAWFNWCFENPEKIKPNHTALYFFCVEHCNRLGWKSKFGLPTTMAKEAIGIRSYNTYSQTIQDLVEWGFIVMVEKSKNQHSSNIIALSNFNKAHDNALDNATIKHATKQGESTGESDSSIDKPLTTKPLNQEPQKATHSFFQSQELNEVFSKWLYACANDVKPAIRKAHGQSAIEALAVKLNCLPVDKAIKQVRQSLENGWVTLRPVDESKLKPDPNAPIIWEQKDIDDYMNNPFISNETKAAFLAERQSTNSLKLNA